MPLTAPVAVPVFPGPNPDPTDKQTYGPRGRARWLYEEDTLRPGLNALADSAYQNAQVAESSAAAASSVIGAAMWAAGTNYATGTSAISPTNYQTYRREAPGGVDATDPATSALWTEIGETRVKKSGDTMMGALEVPAGASGAQVPQAQEVILKTGGAATGPIAVPAGASGAQAPQRQEVTGAWVFGSSVPTTSGTTVSVVGIPDDETNAIQANEIDIHFESVGTNGTSAILLQLGTQLANPANTYVYTTSGYVGAASRLLAASVTSTVIGGGFAMYSSTTTARLSGCIHLSRRGGNTWSCSFTLGNEVGEVTVGGGYVTLSSPLHALRLTTVSGSDLFNNGTIVVNYRI